MGRVTFAAAAAGAALALLAPAASATTTPADDPRARGMTGVAMEYWQTRGLSACPGGVTFQYDDALLSLGLGGGCVATLNADYAASLRTPGLGHSTRRYFAELECQAWTHEAGHALGLAHDESGGVMDPSGYTVPAECRAWARATYPPRKHRAKRQARRDNAGSQRAWR